MAILVPHTFTEGSIRYLLDLPDVYDSDNSTIASAVGLTRQNPSTFEADDDDVWMPVSEGLKAGKLIRLRLSYRDTVNGKIVTKSARIICPTSKVDTAFSSLKGKNYKGNNITGAGIPRRRRLT
ncbi:MULTISPECIES: hypothetical protein [Microcystis]|uniref:hypothetical protein n=1 Tax=Microcystis TaxID=1125 RepID=UPI0016800E75|nr:hypothetical protein [Microcystis wesenbergii]MBD2118854.1 hypothetical protein [Microcystis wesenbergii FACHB-1339]